MAARFDGQIFTFTQPDGTPIQLRGWGDQYYAVFETLDGYTVAKNPATGYWEVARLAPDGNDASCSAPFAQWPPPAVRCWLPRSVRRSATSSACACWSTSVIPPPRSLAMKSNASATKPGTQGSATT